MKKIIQVLGPTGVGKSKIAVALAKKFNGEIISADSMQVYRDFNIGTDKITTKSMENIPHHLVDILGDCSQFNASIFLEKSYAVSEEIISKKRLPIVCGGTALYLKTMIQGIFPEAKEKKVTREEIDEMVRVQGLLELWKKLYQVDPDYAAKIGPNDRVRITRALEIYYNNNIPPSEIFKKNITPYKDYKFIRIGLNLPREFLYKRIEERVDKMIAKGLVQEVKELSKRYSKDCPPFKSLGYKEIVMFLENEISLDVAIELIKQHSRNFAKRQLSWFRQETNVNWFTPQELPDIENFIHSQL